MSNRDDLRHRVEEAAGTLELWSQKGLVLMENLPTEGVCPICFLSGDPDVRPHAIIILCPHPSGFIQTYRWSGDRLVKDQKVVTDHTAVEATVKGLVDRYVGKPQPSDDLAAAAEAALLVMTQHADCEGSESCATPETDRCCAGEVTRLERALGKS